MLLQPYNDRWPQQFNAIETVLLQAMHDMPVRIEHVGSTAVPGLPAKPVIDIDMVIGNHLDFNMTKASLEAIGYYHNGNQGIPGREVFKRMTGLRHVAVLDDMAHHLYICEENSAELRRHLLFRDYLRAYPPAREAYAALKYQLAEAARQDRKRYAQLKEDQATVFFTQILSEAETFLSAQQTISTLP